MPGVWGAVPFGEALRDARWGAYVREVARAGAAACSAGVSGRVAGGVIRFRGI